MKVYIGVGGYGCQCISETNIGKEDIRILIDNEMNDSLHLKQFSETTYKILFDKANSFNLSDNNIQLSSNIAKISEVIDIILKTTSTIIDKISIVVFSTMCGEFGSNNTIEIGKSIESTLTLNHRDSELIFVLLPMINVGGGSYLLKNNISKFIEKCSTNQELNSFLFQKDNVKAFAIYPDSASERKFAHQKFDFLSEITTLLNTLFTKEYIGKKEYKETVIWEHESCFVERLERWLIKAREIYLSVSLNRPDKTISSIYDKVTDKNTIKYIFVSYSHADSPEVLPIIQKLQKEGYNVWYDDGIDPGTEWDENIASHVENCTYFVAMLSKKYLQSDNCKDELNYARDLRKNRLLIYLEECQLPSGMAMRLNRLQSIYKSKYQSEELFYQKLFSANGIGLCKAIFSEDIKLKNQTT